MLHTFQRHLIHEIFTPMFANICQYFTIYSCTICPYRFNDQPHGLFGIQPEHQTVDVDSAGRHVKLLFTRHAGTFGRCFLTYNIRYDLVCQI